ncbi:hypothetical protein PLESTM_000891200 [Pleodorina starrii]|nr:hypothetical protein PLESTM_000891200 [Pleodorina starrii]
MANHTEKLPAILALSVYSLFLILFSIHHVLCVGPKKAVVQTCFQGQQKAGPIRRVLRKLFNKGNLILLALWLLRGVLLQYINVSRQEVEPFEPLQILGLPPGASPAGIKRAFRTTALRYHPDKNPDPRAHAYFAEYITKAYQALTDEVSRKNYELHGHPDGPQATPASAEGGLWLPAEQQQEEEEMQFAAQQLEPTHSHTQNQSHSHSLSHDRDQATEPGAAAAGAVARAPRSSASERRPWCGGGGGSGSGGSGAAGRRGSCGRWEVAAATAAAEGRGSECPPRPRRSSSVFIHFNRTNRRSVRQDNPGAAFGDVSKLLGQQWHALCPEDKVPYEQMAAEDRARYDAALRAYTATQQQRGPSTSAT